MTALVSSLLGGGVLLGLTGGIAALLGKADRAFRVNKDPRTDRILGLLPGANCGGCGFVGCGEYAEAVVQGQAPANKCPAGGSVCAKAIAEIMGGEMKETLPVKAVVHCSATWETRMRRAEYNGEQKCASATLITGIQDCVYGCLGFGDCAEACPFEALSVKDGLAQVDTEKCTGCGKCLQACPRGLISLVPFAAESILTVACANQDRGPDVRKVCTQGCIGCQACTRKHPAFYMNGNLAGIDYLRFDPGDHAAVSTVTASCPMKGIRVVGRISETKTPTVTKKET